MSKLSDAEVIKMELVGEFMGKDHDKGIWRYFRNHWHDWFPNLGLRAKIYDHFWCTTSEESGVTIMIPKNRTTN